MKTFETPFLIGALIVLIIVFGFPASASLETGDLHFTSMDGKSQDRFELVPMVDLPPYTIIRFTDSEWNGTRFGFDEHEMAWNSGKRTIKAGAKVYFTHLNTIPTVSHGSLKNGLHLSQKSEAIFAYLGTRRQPKRFLAAVATDARAFGTLSNTGLKEETDVTIISTTTTSRTDLY
jgi:hypothetical protein